ncbi:MAG: hypothetical protein ACX93N_06760 [Pseudohaliea sp.]
MPIDFAVRRAAREQIAAMAMDMARWENSPRVSDAERRSISERIMGYEPALDLVGTLYCGVDGTGDYPVLGYADSFVYATKAQCVQYEAGGQQGLRQVAPPMPPVFNTAWIPEAPESLRHERFDMALEAMVGMALETIIEESDYAEIKFAVLGKRYSTAQTLANLIRPHAHDSGNIGIQFRSVGELSALARVIKEGRYSDIALMDGTLSLPMVSRDRLSLFYEHLKRWCCVKARDQGMVPVWLSKSHGLPGIESIEGIAAEVLGKTNPSHWFIRLPLDSTDWCLDIAGQRNLPPAGAVTYLWRTHVAMPVFRVDLDRVYWGNVIQDESDSHTRENEIKFFKQLDYASRDMRCHGYPYPIKAAHDDAHWTSQDRVILRKQIIDAAVAAGMKRSAFTSAGQKTGHG